MQDTLAEHARSRARDAPCQSCHMPSVVGADGARHRSHAFRVLGDPAMLRRAVVARAALDGDRLRLELEGGDVGHAFPTGDMFRRLEVRVERLDAHDQVTAAAPPVTLARTFADVPRDRFHRQLGLQRVEATDDRVPPPGAGAREVVLPLPDGEGARVRWRLVYQRMAKPMADAFGVQQVLDEVIVAEGRLAAPSRTASRDGLQAVSQPGGGT
jgi:hypothetical protein